MEVQRDKLGTDKLGTGKLSKNKLGAASVARHARAGFSLLELMLVLAIMGILMGVAAVTLLGQGDKARIRATEMTLNTVGAQVQAYMLENANTPPDSLQVLITDRRLEQGSLNDAWKQPLWYNPNPEKEGIAFELLSFGPDKQYGTEDDIDYWMLRQQ